MAFRWNFCIFIFAIILVFNITEFECKTLSQEGKLNKTLEHASEMLTEYPLGISEVFDNASGVFGKVLGKIISQKKLLGIESFYAKK